MNKDMQRALEIDGEKLRALTGEDHGPFKVELAKAVCERCDGQGFYVVCDDNGEGDPQIEDCPDCAASGMMPVGVFNPICERHCHMCEGEDHHWSYEGQETTAGEPVMSCRHCSALRLMTDGDADTDSVY